jgi:glycosyltransferase involved in cell wall biosynthesis
MGGGLALRIVQLVEDLRVGGLERMAIDLATAHRDAGHDSRIACLLIRGDLAEQAESQGIPVTAFHKPPGFSLPTLFQLALHLQDVRPHVVHSHNSGVHHYAALACAMARIPALVNTRHGISQSNGQPFNDRWFRRVMPLTSKVVSVSSDSRRFYEQRGIVPPHKSAVIINGTRLDAYRTRPARPEPARPDPSRLRLGTVGRLVPVKGHSYLLDAFAEVHRALPHATLDIVGYGPLEAELRHQARDLPVTFLGARDDVPDQLASYDLFVFSSLSEGLPMTILEAMAAGLPIASTRVGGIPEVAPEGEIAWYAPPADAPALARAILDAARSNLSAAGQRARQLAFDHYSLETMQRQYESLYRSLLS